MDLKQYVKDNPEKTLEEVQGYAREVDTKQVGSGQARGLFVSTNGTDGNPLWTTFSAAAADVTNPLFPLASAIIITASDGSSYFGMDETKADGQANREGLATLVAYGIMTQAVADAFIAKTISTSYPFSDVTPEEYTFAKEEDPVFTEVTYISEEHPNQHLVRVASQHKDAIELEFTVTDDTQNVNFEVKTMSCTDLSSTAAKDNLGNYQPVSAKWLVKMGESTNLVDHIEKNYKIKSVVKLFVKPSVNCAFTCVAR